MVEREYAFGIYMFIDIQNGEVVYIGLDSHIDQKKRINDHYQPCKYDRQPFNSILQNNPDRFKPFVYCEVDTWEEMSQLEFDLINLYRPRFNYQQGGCDRSLINKEFKYTVSKAGTNKKKQCYQINSMFKKQLVSSYDYSYLSDLCVNLNNNELSEEEVKNINRKRSIINNTKSNNATGFSHVYKQTCKSCKNGFIWKYQYYDENKKRKVVTSTDIFKLKLKVEMKGLHWEVLDAEKARESIKQNGG